MSNSLGPHGQHTRLPCPSLSPGVCSNSCPLSWWYHPTISFSVAPFSSCPQSFPASGSFPLSQLFTSGGQSIGASTSASVLPMNIQDWFPLKLTGLISLLSKTLKSFLQHHTSKASILQCSAFFMVQHSHLQGAYLCPRDYRLSNSKTELPPWSLFLVLSEMVWGNCWQYSFFQSQLLIRVSLAGIHTFVFPTSVPLLF